jgi:hypothetical protein
VANYGVYRTHTTTEGEPMEIDWKDWAMAITTAAVATLIATGHGQIVIDLIASTGIATADSLTWLIAQGAAS